jgi:hypothetical protein
VILKEKFKAMGLLPVKLVSRKPSQREGYKKKSIKFSKMGEITPNIRIKLFEKSKLNFLFSISKFIMSRNGIKKKAVGFIMMLSPKIILPSNCHLISENLRKI